MYVCVCNGITDRQLRSYIEEHRACSLSELKSEMGIGNRCGRCESCAVQYLECAGDAARERSALA
ncbi:MAG: (2Fe-2S)-binding protein [Burkholderiales bacterium]|nr:(2Fe-2S)-binding protein [Burkholderiales bacterium]